MTGSTCDLVRRFDAGDDDEKVRSLFGTEQGADAERVDFLLRVASDSGEADFVRIEAVKAAGIAAGRLPECRDRTLDALWQLARDDADDDVRCYALQALAWHPLPDHMLHDLSALAVDPREDGMVRENAFGALTSHATDAATRGSVLARLVDDPTFGASAARELRDIG